MNLRTCISVFHTDYKTLETKEVRIPFDFISSVKVSHNLTVCTCDAIRGRDKTFHTYKEQSKISISGTFSERVVSELITNFSSSEDSSILYLNYKNNGNRLKTLQNLFLSFVQDTRLFYIHTRFKTYKNYVLTDCSFSDSSSVSSIKVELSFIEIMFRNNEELYSDTLIKKRDIEIMNFPPLQEEVAELKINLNKIRVSLDHVANLTKDTCKSLMKEGSVTGNLSNQKLWDKFDKVKESHNNKTIIKVSNRFNSISRVK